MIYIAKFFRMSQKEIRTDNLIECIELAKKMVIDSNIQWEAITIFNEKNEIVDKLSYLKDMFSNGCHWKMLSKDELYLNF